MSYNIPLLPDLLAISSFLYLINVAETVFARLIHAGLLGSLCIGIAFGPQAAHILPTSIQDASTTLGYIGLLVIVFEAGLTTDMTLLRKNLALSSAIALTGTAMPIFLSIVLLHYGFKYGTLESFASGAALSSTSLGTTMALLKPEWRATVAGTALMTAALLDDVCGLVIAAVLSQLAGASVVIPWYIIARPILVSLAFAIGTFFAALSLGCLFRWYPVKLRNKSLLFIMIALLTGYVAGSHYAGTSELFGAYLAGALLAYIFPRDGSLSAFETHIRPILHVFLSPVFFASIGMALPIRALGSINGSNRVVWRGIVYSMLMGLAKFCSALWMLVWRTDVRSAVLVGFGMIARGEVALIVTQLALPLLSTEAYAVVTWATLLNTAGGAILVGCFLRRVAEIE